MTSEEAAAAATKMTPSLPSEHQDPAEDASSTLQAPSTQIHSIIQTINDLQRQYNDEMATQDELKNRIEEEQEKIQKMKTLRDQLRGKISSDEISEEVGTNDDDSAASRISSDYQCDTSLQLHRTIEHLNSQLQLELLKLSSLQYTKSQLEKEMNEMMTRIQNTHIPALDLPAIQKQAEKSHHIKLHQLKHHKQQYQQKQQQRDCILRDIQMMQEIEKEKKRVLKELRDRRFQDADETPQNDVHTLKLQRSKLRQKLESLASEISKLRDEIRQHHESIEKRQKDIDSVKGKLKKQGVVME